MKPLRGNARAAKPWTIDGEFYTRMGKDGRIVIPKLTIRLLQVRYGDLIGRVLQIDFEPAQSP